MAMVDSQWCSSAGTWASNRARCGIGVGGRVQESGSIGGMGGSDEKLLDVFQGNATVSAGFSRPAQTLEQGGQGRWSRRDGAGGQECAGPGAHSVGGQAWTAEGVLRKPSPAHPLFFRRLRREAGRTRMWRMQDARRAPARPGQAHLKLGAGLGLGAQHRTAQAGQGRAASSSALGCVCLGCLATLTERTEARGHPIPNRPLCVASRYRSSPAGARSAMYYLCTRCPPVLLHSHR